jgi:hypothetical protein
LQTSEKVGAVVGSPAALIMDEMLEGVLRYHWASCFDAMLDTTFLSGTGKTETGSETP